MQWLANEFLAAAARQLAAKAPPFAHRETLSRGVHLVQYHFTIRAIRRFDTQPFAACFCLESCRCCCKWWPNFNSDSRIV